MYNQTDQREMEIIRYKFRTNSRLNLEFRSALSKLFRDYRQPVDDEILSKVILALPDELVGLAPSLQPLGAATRTGRNGGSSKSGGKGRPTTPPQGPKKPLPQIPPEGTKKKKPAKKPRPSPTPPQGPGKGKGGSK